MKESPMEMSIGDCVCGCSVCLFEIDFLRPPGIEAEECSHHCHNH